MKKHLAHALRRTARRMIAWSNRLDGPAQTFGNGPIFLGTHTVPLVVAKSVPENAYFTMAPPA